MRDRLYLAGIHLERLQEEPFPISRDRGMGDPRQLLARLRILRERIIELCDGRLGAPQNVALVRCVRGPEQLAPFSDESSLERGGASIDAQIGCAPVVCQGCATHLLACMACDEGLMLSLVSEERIQAHDLGALHVAEALQPADDIRERLHARTIARTGDGSAARHEQMRVARDDDGIIVELERLVEAAA